MTTKKDIKYQIVTNRFFTALAYHVLKLYYKTLILSIDYAKLPTSHIDKGTRIIFCCWHQRFFGGLLAPQILQKPLHIMISQSRDGDFISFVAQKFGWQPVRGSSSRGGQQALKSLIHKVSESGLATHIVDGPTGPPYIIKRGLVSLARETQAAIVPVYIVYDNPWIFKKSWDRFMVPKPFTKIRISFGPLTFVPSDSTEMQEGIRQTLENTMIETYKKLDLQQHS